MTRPKHDETIDELDEFIRRVDKSIARADIVISAIVVALVFVAGFACGIVWVLR